MNAVLLQADEVLRELLFFMAVIISAKARELKLPELQVFS
jgi:hypothetical protein